MNKEQYRREEMEQERIDDLEAEQTQEYLVKFKGSIYVDATSKEDAIIKAQDNPDLFEYIDDWEGC